MNIFLSMPVPTSESVGKWKVVIYPRFSRLDSSLASIPQASWSPRLGLLHPCSLVCSLWRFIKVIWINISQKRQYGPYLGGTKVSAEDIPGSVEYVFHILRASIIPNTLYAVYLSSIRPMGRSSARTSLQELHWFKLKFTLIIQTLQCNICIEWSRRGCDSPCQRCIQVRNLVADVSASAFAHSFSDSPEIRGPHVWLCANGVHADRPRYPWNECTGRETTWMAVGLLYCSRIWSIAENNFFVLCILEIIMLHFCEHELTS